MTRWDKQLFDKVMTTYRKKDSKLFFDENEKVYDAYLRELFGGYEEHKDDSAYHAALFAKLEGLFATNSKAYSALKHLSYDLAELLTKAGKLIHKISAAYDAAIGEEERAYGVIKMTAKTDVDAINKKLKIGLEEWGSQLIAQSRHVIDNCAGFFHYRKHESLAFAKLLAAKQECNAAYAKSAGDLEKTKRKLYDAKNTERWKVDFNAIDGDFNELFKDYERIKPYMLPEAS